MLKTLLNDKKIIKYILILFVVSRIILTLVGLGAREYGLRSPLLLSPGAENINYTKPFYVKQNWLDIWGEWDSSWYMNIAEKGYSTDKVPSGPNIGQANYAFFPLYPILMRLFGFYLNHTFLAGVIISNLAFLISAYVLYKLVCLDEDKITAQKTVKYLFLFPTAFIFSGVFTESLFLCLALLCFYFAKRGYWWAAGITGFFLSLTRILGVFIIIPLLLIYLMEKRKEMLKPENKKDYFFLFKSLLNKKLLPLLLIPCGLILWSGFNYFLTGDWLGFIHIMSAWGRRIITFYTETNLGITDIFHPQPWLLIITVFFWLFFIIKYFHKISFPYWFYAFYSIAIPLSSGPYSIPRYLLVVFPLYLICAKIGQNKLHDYALSLTLALLQIFLMLFWSVGSKLVI